MNEFKFYDPERKNKFLYDEYPNEDTRKTYGSLLSKISYYEEDNHKDLCDFSLSEANDLMIGLMKTSENSVDVAHTIINMYINWCIDQNQNYSKTGFNSFKLLDKKDKQRFVHKVAQKLSYITRDEMYEKCEMLYNYIDKAMVCGIFELIKGRPEQGHSLEELRNLKKTDLLPEINRVILTRFDENNIPMTRSIKVDKRTMNIFVIAAKEEIYHKENGESKTTFAIMELKDNQYLIRTADNGGDGEDDRIKIPSINSRFKIIRKYTKSPFLTPTNLFFSGLFERCEQLEKQYGGKLMVEHYRQIYRDLELADRQGATLKLKYEAYKKNKALK
jgi:hypothetical protein